MKAFAIAFLLVCTALTTLSAQELRPDNAGKIAMEANRLYIVVPYHGFAIYDVSNTRTPREIRFVELEGIVDIALRGEFIFANQYQDLILLKVPLDPKVAVKEIKRQANVFPSRAENRPGIAYSYENFDAYKSYLADNPAASPAPSASVNGSMSCLALAGDYIYAVDGQEVKTYIAKPTHPEVLSRTNNINMNNEQLETVWTDGANRLYVGSQMGLHIVDITDRAQPRLLGSYRHQRSCDPVVVAGNIAYSTQRDGRDCAGGVNQLDVVNIADPFRPTRIRNYPLTNPHGLAVQGTLLMICDGRDGLKIFDASNPSGVKQIGHVPGLATYDVLYDAGKQTAFVSVPKELHLYSMQQPSSPSRQSVIVLPSMN